MLVLQIVPERLALDDHVLNLFRRREFEDVPKAFALQVAKRSAQLLALLPDHVWSKIAISAAFVSILAKSLREIEYNGDRYYVILARQSYERLTRLHLNVGRINDSEPAGLEPLGADKVQDLKSRICRCLIILIIGD
jgi:hypothetical protein